jgi:hypothetical protein
MPLRSQIALTLALFMAVPNVHAAESSRKSWSELSQEVRSEWTVRLFLPDTTVVEGKGARFTEEGVVLQVVRSSNPRAHPIGALTVPRSSVKTLDLRRNRLRGQVLGFTIPLVAGSAIAGAGAAKGAFQGGGLMLAGVLVGVAAIPLYFLGRASDRRWESITIMP